MTSQRCGHCSTNDRGSCLVPASITTDPPAVDAPLREPVDEAVPPIRGQSTRDDGRRVAASLAGSSEQFGVTSTSRSSRWAIGASLCEPVDDARTVGVGDSEHGGDVAVEVDEQRGSDRVDRAGARDDRRAAAALGGVAERDHGFPQVGRAGGPDVDSGGSRCCQRSAERRPAQRSPRRAPRR